MKTLGTPALSLFAVPLLALGGTIFGFSHPGGLAKKTLTAPAPLTLLLDPDPRLNTCFAIFLRRQVANVHRCRARLQQAEARDAHELSPLTLAEARRRRAGLAQAVADYNLIARECTPAVFQITRLPVSQEP